MNNQSDCLTCALFKYQGCCAKFLCYRIQCHLSLLLELVFQEVLEPQVCQQEDLEELEWLQGVSALKVLLRMLEKKKKKKILNSTINRPPFPLIN